MAGFATFDGTTYQTGSLTAAELNAGQGTRRGFWIFAQRAGTTMTYTAQDVVNVTTTSEMRAGWNMLAFPANAPVPGNTLVVRRDGATVPLSSEVLPFFSQINPDGSYTTVDVTQGGSLTPGRAFWVYALHPVTLSWGMGPSPSPSPSSTATPLPGASPSPSPVVTASPSPGTSPTPGPSPSPTATLTAVRFNISGLARVTAMSSDGQRAVALRQDAPAYRGVIQDVNLQTSTLTEDTSAYVTSNNDSGALAPVSNDDCSFTTFEISRINNTDPIGLHQRASNTSDELADGQRYNTNADLSATGLFSVYQGGNGSGFIDTFFKIPGGTGGSLTQASALDTTFFNYYADKCCLSDDAGLASGYALLREVTRISGGPSQRTDIRVNLSTNEVVTALPNGVQALYPRLSGNGQYILYATSVSPTQVYVRDINAQTAPELVSRTAAGAAGNAQSDIGGLLGRQISGSGRFVLFTSDASDLVPGVSGLNVFLRDRTNGTTTRVNVDETGARNPNTTQAGMSRNGQWIFFSAPGSLWRVRNPAL